MADKLETEFKNLIDGIAVAPPEMMPTFASEGDKRKTNPNLWKPGQSGNPAGRPQGAKQNKTVRQIAEELNFNPIEAAILIIREDPRIRKKFKIRQPVEVKDKAALLRWIGDKMYASLKSVDYTVFDGGEENKPKTIQLYLPEKGSVDKLEKTEREVVKLELTPELANDMVPSCDPVDKK